MNIISQQEGTVLCDQMSKNTEDLAHLVHSDINVLGGYVQDNLGTLSDSIHNIDDKLFANRQLIDSLLSQQENILENITDLSSLSYLILQLSDSSSLISSESSDLDFSGQLARLNSGIFFEDASNSIPAQVSPVNVCEGSLGHQSSEIINVNAPSAEISVIESSRESARTAIPPFSLPPLTIPSSGQTATLAVASSAVASSLRSFDFRNNSSYRENPSAFFHLDPVRMMEYRQALLELRGLEERPSREDLVPSNYVVTNNGFLQRTWSLFRQLLPPLGGNPVLSRALVVVSARVLYDISHQVISFPSLLTLPSTLSGYRSLQSNSLSTPLTQLPDNGGLLSNSLSSLESFSVDGGDALLLIADNAEDTSKFLDYFFYCTSFIF